MRSCCLRPSLPLAGGQSLVLLLLIFLCHCLSLILEDDTLLLLLLLFLLLLLLFVSLFPKEDERKFVESLLLMKHKTGHKVAMEDTKFPRMFPIDNEDYET